MSDINQLPIPLTLKLDQINVVIAALAKLPYEQVAELVNQVRNAALAALNADQEREQAAMAQQKAQDELPMAAENAPQTDSQPIQ